MILIQSVLGALAIYMMSVFSIPKSVAKRLNGIMRNFLWRGTSQAKKYPLVAWEKVCTEKDKGGLGIRDLITINDSLLCKWLWRYSVEQNAMWRRLIKEKYGAAFLGWDTKIPKLPYGNSIWRGVCNRMAKFKEGIIYKVGKGDRTLFWQDRWLGDATLQVSYPNLFRVSRRKQHTVRQFYSLDGNGQVNWNLDLRRRLTDIEITEASNLTNQLQHFTPTTEEDTRHWKWTKDDIFTVCSCYSALHKHDITTDFPINVVWNTNVPTRVCFFTWLVHHNSILTLDNLATRGRTLVNRCCMCKEDLESINHLFIHCKVANEI